MNLINDAWIPVRRKSGKKEKIAPANITKDLANDPIIDLAALRPDFNGALIQFLIGLLQTTCAPNNNSEWRKWLDNPPPPDELKHKFEKVAFAFNLDGDGPRFMQDLTLENEQQKTEETIDKLLMDSPGEQTLKYNIDHFVKRRRVEKLCISCAAQALLTLQLNAPLGGKGHRVGLRGGGPVSTIILGNNLWATVWSNILDKSRFDYLATPVKTVNSDRFPWCGETRTSEKNETTRNQDIHPAQIYWSMPRRIRFVFSQNNEQCDLCGNMDRIIKEYLTKPYGVMYKGIIHPLTPVYEKVVDNKTELLSAHQHETVGYKHWLGYVQAYSDERSKKKVAEVINQIALRREINFRLFAFGYDMANMKACCWYEGVMPVVTLEDEEKRNIYEAEIVCIVRAVDTVAYQLRIAVKSAWFGEEKKDVRLRITQRFWQDTEADFYKLILRLREEITAGKDRLSTKQEWHKCIVRKAEQIFDEVSQAEMIDEVNVKRVADAWNAMRRNINSRKLRQEILGLPERVHETKSS